LTYDLIVIGSGPGGYVAAIRAAQLGLKVACVEKDKPLGGTCLNVGCIPSKALLHSSELYWKLGHEYAAHGIQVENARVDFSKLMARKEEIVKGFNVGIESLFKKHKIDRILGYGRLSGAHAVSVDGKTIEGKNILLATGSEPASLPFLPFDEQKVLSSTGALCLKSVPKKLLVIGAGIIGVELGSVYQRLGSEVVFIEFLDRICPTFDAALSQALQKSLTAQGMKFHLSHQVTSARVGSGVEVMAKSLTGEVQFQGDAVLVAIGRKPFTRDLGLNAVGISPDPKGFIPIDASFRTQVPWVFAIGDIVSGPMLAHKASEEGVAVAELIAGQRPSIDYASIPSVAYTSPEVAAVGFTEEELKAKKVPYKVGQFPFKANSRARCTGEADGFVKMLVEEPTKKLLGVHIIGAHASELIAEAVLALKLRLTALEIADACHAHPTLSEALKEAALAATKGAIHM
jgi:dihydrolipoamide dehydrogenase